MKIKKEFLVYYKQFHDELAGDSSDDHDYVLDDKGVLQQAHDISEFKKKKSQAKVKSQTPKNRNVKLKSQ